MSHITIDFDEATTNIDAIKAAAYKLTDQCMVKLSVIKPNIICDITFSKSPSEEAVLKFEHEFRSMVLDEEIRIKIYRDTEPVRNLILSYAFSQTNLS